MSPELSSLPFVQTKEESMKVADMGAIQPDLTPCQEFTESCGCGVWRISKCETICHLILPVVGFLTSGISWAWTSRTATRMSRTLPKDDMPPEVSLNAPLFEGTIEAERSRIALVREAAKNRRTLTFIALFEAVVVAVVLIAKFEEG